jgi:hypothetical protein
VRALLVLVLVALPGVAWAQQPAPKPERVIAVAPLTALGAEDTSASAKQVQEQLEKAVAAVPGTQVIGSKAALAAVKKAKRPELRVCEGDMTCLTELGKLVGADLVVAGEAGGLGDVKVVYLQLVEVSKARSVRSTTLEVGDDASGGAEGAAYRLLAPDRYVGTTTLNVDAKGATIYVDGKKVGKSPSGPIQLSVGTHALRVTHPEYRDFVRFVDVGFQSDTAIDVALQQFPIVQSELTGDGTPAGNVTYIDKPAPWYRKWWAIAAFSGIVVVGAAATAGIIADGVDADTVRPVTPD